MRNHMRQNLSPRQMLHKFSRGLVRASAVVEYFETSSQMNDNPRAAHFRHSAYICKHTHTHLYRPFYIQTLLHTNAFTHRHFYTKTLLQTDHFTHTDTFTHRYFYTQTLLHTNAFGTLWNCNFTSVFDDRTSFRAKGLRRHLGNRNFTSVFDDRTSFRAKGLRGHLWNRNFTSVFDDRTSFRAKRLRWVRKGCADKCGQVGNRNFASVFDDRTSFRAKGLRGHLWNRNFTSVFDDRTSFRAKGLRGQMRTSWKSQFYLSFWRSNLISCERVAFRGVSLPLPLLPPSKEK